MQDNHHHIFSECLVRAVKSSRANIRQRQAAITLPLTETWGRIQLLWRLDLRREKQAGSPSAATVYKWKAKRPTQQLITVCYLTVVTSWEKLEPRERRGHTSQLCGVCMLHYAMLSWPDDALTFRLACLKSSKTSSRVSDVGMFIFTPSSVNRF